MTNFGDAQVRPQNAGAYARISDDPSGLKKGVGRQTEDMRELAARTGWKIGRFYIENDVSAFKKRKVTLPDGSVVWRVIRPEWRKMLDDFHNGVIDGLIVYDLDRLARQPRDLEDLIDLVEYHGRPVAGVTGTIDLMTSGGRAMARVLLAMANKSSEDTARRVARESLARANEGKTRKLRRFGRTIDGELIAEEVEVIRWAAGRITDGASWAGTVKILEDGDVRPVNGGTWSVAALRRYILRPTVAGIAVYNGGMRGKKDDRSLVQQLTGSALKNADGSYVMTDLDPILTVEEWEALVSVVDECRNTTQFTGKGTRKYLLSGLLRCGREREDGTICNVPLVGTWVRDKRHEPYIVYRCPGPAQRGCGNLSRHAARTDELIEDLLFEYIAAKAPTANAVAPQAAGPSQDQADLDATTQRLEKLREGYAAGTTSDETFFATVPLLEARIKQLKKAISESGHISPRGIPIRTVEQVRAHWDRTDVAGKRAILGQYLTAIVVKPSASRGRAKFDHTAFKPVWIDTAA
ncbi:recombinase family protein [Actinospica sp. MGRD01-02]|uniref:Recombinase family protein n=1 Tax=Actinospica acidithermotolerans TaxID=2828514 RepID=A0A941EFW5_9ACTN|nr:recombinase family protein [Actinospica acidithermotolerans]MBR7830571.1 recombinase family protein [Actinospica acidithermotolerans]